MGCGSLSPILNEVGFIKVWVSGKFIILLGVWAEVEGPDS